MEVTKVTDICVLGDSISKGIVFDDGRYLIRL